MNERKRVFCYPADVRFQCSLCAICCGNTSSRTRHVLLLPKEADSISMFIGLPIKDLALRMEGKEPYSFEMRKIDGKCFFLHGNQCSIYGLRPLLCKFYPFSLETDGNGKFRFQVTSECPGLGTGLLLKKPYYERLFNEARFQHGIEE